MNINIITIATEDYIKYFKGFMESIHKFFPDQNKWVTLLTDYTGDFDDINSSVHFERKYIYPLIYPTVNVNKPIFLNEEIKEKSEKYDYVFIIDVDTIFITAKHYIWESLKVKMDSGAILLNTHPFYRLNDGARHWNIPKDELIQNLYTANLTEKDDRFSSYIPDGEYTYINSSFWGGNTAEVKRFNDAIIELTRKDLTKYPYGYHIPRYMDENYVNYLYYCNEYLKDNTFKLEVGGYSVLYNTDSWENDSVFMYQKNMEEITNKKNRR